MSKDVKMNKEEVSASLDRYTEDAYKLAFILTLSEEGAVSVMEDAVEEMTVKGGWGGKDEKTSFFALICKHAKKCRIPPMTAEELTEKYGKKSDDFYTLIAQPKAERARLHMIYYEDMSEEDAAKAAGK